MLSEELPPVPQRQPHPFFDDAVVLTSKPRGNARLTPRREATIAQAIKMRKGGMSYSKIATHLSVGKTTVRKWMFDAKVP
jgi:DNA invertase Pin-like site-specific DNA recombinase